jgi:hypothetical protein
MSTNRILIHGTTAQLMATTPAIGQIGSDDETKQVIVGDGATPGGIPMAREDQLPPASRLLPEPAEEDAGKVVVVNEDGDGYALGEGGVKTFAPGAILPAANIGPIWHADYASIMTWQAFSANGASYAGYASVEIGTPRLDGQSTARAGFLKRNGGSYSKATYAALWNWALHNGRVVSLGSWAAGAFVFADNGNGTFKVPDSRGEFERIWDDGRGVDSGRVFGSSQLDQQQQITGTLTGVAIRGGGTASGAFSRTIGAGGSASNTNPSVSDLNFDNANSPGARVGAENRSRNVALLGTIKF